LLDDGETLVVDGLTFVWSRRKAAANRRKHRVTFEEAATVFADPLAQIRQDRRHSHAEPRSHIMGYSLLGRPPRGSG